MAPSKHMTWLQFWLRVSRPRFWMYTLGPYLLGIVSAPAHMPPAWSWLGFAFAIFFTFPANLLIYGVNDIFDYDTDKNNPKKQGYEILVQPSRYGLLWTGIIIFNAPFLLLAFRLSQPAQASLFGFLFFSLFYSAPPIRAKIRPLLDSFFNILYVFPALAALYIFGGTHITLTAVIAGTLWSMAMHAYSAVPDITQDKEAGIHTIATLLGRQDTFLACFLWYAVAAVLASFSLGWLPAGLLFAPYLVMMVLSLKSKSDTAIFKLYRFFPTLNTIIGFSLFWIIVWLKS